MILTRGLDDRVVVSTRWPVRINRYNELQPDVILVRPRENFYGTRHPRPEDVLLLIEVSDATLKTDQHVKLPLYARSGIPDTWIIDIKNDAIHTYREPNGNEYAITSTKRRGESVAADAFPAFSINVDDLLGPR